MLDNLDREFLTSMNDIQEFMRERNWYPGFSFSGSINPKNTETNNFANSGKSALLYSGGIDSITSYLKNRKSKACNSVVHASTSFDLATPGSGVNEILMVSPMPCCIKIPSAAELEVRPFTLDPASVRPK